MKNNVDGYTTECVSYQETHLRNNILQELRERYFSTSDYLNIHVL